MYNTNMERDQHVKLRNQKHYTVCVCVCVLLFSHSAVRLFATPWTAAHQVSLASPSLEVCPSPHPLHQWCCPAISSSDTLLSLCPQSFPASGTFPMSQLFYICIQNFLVLLILNICSGYIWRLVLEYKMKETSFSLYPLCII